MHLLWFVTICFATVTAAIAKEVSVRVNTIKPINIVDDRFLSFTLDVEGLDDNAIENYQVLTEEMSAAYVKLSTVPLGLMMKCSSNSSDTTQDVDELLKWETLQQWMSSANWIPVISLPHDPFHWKLDNVFKILNAAVGSNLQSCVWQLGSEFISKDALDYIKDLTTLQLIVDNLKPVESWNIIGADISVKSDPEATKLYTDLSQGMVEAISWIQPTEACDTIPNESTLKRYSRCDVSAWLGAQRNQKPHEANTAEEIEVVRRLGEAARLGFKVTFQQLKKLEHFLVYHGTLLFKRIMGTKVFDVRVIGKVPNATHIYCHCAKGRPGALSFMAVNTGGDAMKVSVKTSDMNTGSELWQYTLTNKDSSTLLNEEEINENVDFEPIVKIKHPAQPIEIVLPPMSVSFYVLPFANNRECLRDAIINNSIKKSKRNVLSYRPATCRSTSILDTIKRRALQQKLSNRILFPTQGKKCKCSREAIETRRKRSVAHSVLVVRNRANYVPKSYFDPTHAANEKVYVINRNDKWKGTIVGRETEDDSRAEKTEGEEEHFEYLKADEPTQPVEEATKHTPKFVRYTSDKVTNFVKTVTDHITNWWNAWAV